MFWYIVLNCAYSWNMVTFQIYSSKNLLLLIKLLSRNSMIAILLTCTENSKLNVHELPVNHQSKQKSIKKLHWSAVLITVINIIKIIFTKIIIFFVLCSLIITPSDVNILHKINILYLSLFLSIFEKENLFYPGKQLNIKTVCVVFYFNSF